MRSIGNAGEVYEILVHLTCSSDAAGSGHVLGPAAARRRRRDATDTSHGIQEAEYQGVVARGNTARATFDRSRAGSSQGKIGRRSQRAMCLARNHTHESW